MDRTSSGIIPIMRRLLSTGVVTLGVVIALTAAPEPSQAQAGAIGISGASPTAGEAVAVPRDIAPDGVAPFVAHVTDREARDLLIRTLKDEAERRQAVSAKADAGLAGFLMTLRGNVQSLHDRISEIRSAVSSADEDIHKSFQLLTDLEGWPTFWRGLLVALAVLAIGTGVELGLRKVLLGGDKVAAGPPLRQSGGRWAAAVITLLLDTISLGAFVIAAYAASLAFLDRFDPMRELVVAVIFVVVTTRAAAILAERVLEPGKPARRLLPVTDREAARLKAQATGIVALVSFATFSHALFRLIALPEPLLQLHLLGFGALLTAFVVAQVVRRDGAASASQRTAWANVAPGLTAIIVIFAFGLWAVNTLLGRFAEGASAVLAVVIVLAIPLVERSLAAIFFHIRADQEDGSTTADGAIARLDPFLRFSLRAFFGLIALALFAEAGRFGLFAWFATPAGARTLRAAIDIGVTVVLAAVLWEFVTIWIDRKLAEQGDGVEPGQATIEDGEAGTGKAATRAETLLPLVQSFLFFVLVAAVAMIVLSSLGVDIGPLLAGAGVVGIAIGFGAQTLVRDIVSGVFFLIDDAFRIGEYIEMGNIRGEVERISLRSLTLRHHRGALYSIPFGELKSIANYSRDWAIYKMEFGIEYESDIALVKKIIKKIGAELLADPEHGHRFIEPLKSQGIVAFADSALTVRVKFKCKPREQFVLRRIVLERIKQEFAKEGVNFAYPRVVVHAESGAPGEALTAAAKSAVERAAPGKAPKDA